MKPLIAKLKTMKKPKYLNLMEKRNHHLFLVSLLFIILFVQCDIAPGNIVPVDSNYGGFPVPSNYEVNHPAIPVFFKQESINVTFDSSKAHINAFYTLENNKSIAIDMGIALPFLNESEKDIESLSVQEKELDYIWLDEKEITDIPFFRNSGKYFHVIAFNLSFTAYEEKTIHIQYSREYNIYNNTTGLKKETHYGYSYLVGTARAWNRPLESASFEFWVPKRLSDHIPKNHRNMSVRETPNYYILSVKYENWLLSDNYETIGVWWTQTIEDWSWAFLFLFGLIPGFSVTIAILVITKRRTKKPALTV